MKKIIKSSLTGLTLSALYLMAAGANAGDLFDKALASENPNQENTYLSHIYAGVSVGQSNLNPRVNHANGEVTKSTDTSYKLYAGYNINKNMAVEGFYTDLGAAEVSIDNTKSKVGYKMYGISGVASKNLNKRTKAFAKLGLAGLKNSVSNNLRYKKVKNVAITTGLGLEFKLRENLSVRGEYEYFDKDIQSGTVGLKWDNY